MVSAGNGVCGGPTSTLLTVGLLGVLRRAMTQRRLERRRPTTRARKHRRIFYKNVTAPACGSPTPTAACRRCRSSP